MHKDIGPTLTFLILRPPPPLQQDYSLCPIFVSDCCTTTISMHLLDIFNTKLRRQTESLMIVTCPQPLLPDECISSHLRTGGTRLQIILYAPLKTFVFDRIKIQRSPQVVCEIINKGHKGPSRTLQTGQFDSFPELLYYISPPSS